MKLTKLLNVSLVASTVLAMLLAVGGCRLDGHDNGRDGGRQDEHHDNDRHDAGHENR